MSVETTYNSSIEILSEKLIEVALNNIPKQLSGVFKEHGQILQYSSDTVISSEGDIAEGVYVLVEGFAYNTKTINSETIVSFLSVGDLVNVENCRLGLPNSLTTKSVCDVKTLFISSEVFNKIIDSDPSLQLPVLNVVMNSLNKLDKSKSNKITLSLKHQFVVFLMDIKERINNTGHLFIPINRKLLANYFSCSKSSLSRLLTQLESKGLITTKLDGFTINNKVDLKQFV